MGRLILLEDTCVCFVRTGLTSRGRVRWEVCRRRDAAVLKRKAVSRITVGAEKRQLISIFKMGYSWTSRPLGSSEKMISFCLLIFPFRCIDALCKYVADIQIWMCECVVVDELRAGLVINPPPPHTPSIPGVWLQQCLFDFAFCSFSITTSSRASGSSVPVSISSNRVFDQN